MKKLFIIVFTLCLALCFAFTAYSQDLSSYLPKGDYVYDKNIPTPKEFLGFEIAEQHVNYNEICSYMKLLASKSDRIKILEHGRTYEFKPLQFLIISSPENLKNISEIQKKQMSLCDPDKSSSLNIKDMPIVIWLGYSVHGNEASGVNSTLAVAYFLAAAQGEQIDEILKKSVIIMHPGQNPDGIQKYATWVNATRSFTPVSDPNSREFKEPAPNSRLNHYWFDLNRDWLVVQHPESYYRNQIQVAWHPTVVGDFHEYGSSTPTGTYFSPGKITGTNPVIPQKNWEMTHKMSRYYSKYLDMIGTLYFSKEGYDDWYTGKGAAYPDLMGGVASLFEQPSSRGHIQQKSTMLLKFSDQVRNQAYCSYASIIGALELKEELQNYQRESYIQAQKEAKKSAIKGYVFGNPKDKSLDIEFFRILNASMIDVYILKSDIKAGGIEYRAGEAYVVPCKQNEYRIIRTIFEKELNFIDSTFYDISTWTIPYGFNMNYAELSSVSGIIGDKVVSIDNVFKTPSKAEYAYVFEINDYYSYGFLYKILEKGIKVKICQKPFEMIVDGVKYNFNAGMMYIPIADQKFSSNEIYDYVIEYSKNIPIDIISSNTGFGENIDLGSKSFKYLSLPKIALVWGDGAYHSGLGEIWHMLDQRFKIPVSLIQSTTIGKIDLSKYNIIVLYGDYTFDEYSKDKIKAWASSNNNTIIAMDKAYKVLNEIGLTNINILKRASNNKKPGIYAKVSDVKKTDPNSIIDGVILESNIDKSNPICYGIEADRMYTFKRATTMISKPLSQYITPVYYKKSPLISGCITKKNLAILSETPCVLASRKIIYFVDDPCFRAYWYGSSRMLLNSFFFRELLTTDKIATEKEENNKK